MITARPPTVGGRKLAINRLRDRRPLDAATVDRFLARNQVPIVEGPRCTFLYRGEADGVFLVHRVFGLPSHLPLRRLHGNLVKAATRKANKNKSAGTVESNDATGSAPAASGDTAATE